MKQRPPTGLIWLLLAVSLSIACDRKVQNPPTEEKQVVPVPSGPDEIRAVPSPTSPAETERREEPPSAGTKPGPMSGLDQPAREPVAAP